MATVWDVSTAVYEEKYKDISTEDGTPFGIALSSDGTKMYVAGYNTATIYQYSLSTPWGVDTAVYADKCKDVSTEVDRPYGIDISSDGNNLYVASFTYDSIFQYTLSTAWDVSTATYNDKYKDVGVEEDSLDAVSLKPDGTKMYIVGAAAHTVFQYTLSTPWDVSTATYEEKSKLVGTEDAHPYAVPFKPDGNKMYILGWDSKTVYQYALSTTWDVSTAVYEDKYKSVNAQDIAPRGLCFKSDGAKMYISGDVSNKIYQYDLPVAEIFYKSLSGSFGFTGSVVKLTKKMLTGSLTFLGSIFLGRFLQATLSISCNESELSVYSNESALSIYENESILSIEE